ncbi:hypothetical protein MLD38_030090 [Melastoma candidum]|uniref:Uncharacterized protein n=1 Tax=Melastoma candidum TaxID=119954 RepID=A0ACB9MQW1_9MYRT|nr:hypothetical protein MLD38_030090 [Melastoma candidum]
MPGAAPTRHVAVAAFPLSSHPSAMLDLARGIADSAPTGTVFSFFNTESSNAKLFRDVDRFGGIRRCDVDYGFDGGPSQVAVASYQRVAPESLRGAVRRAEEEVGLKVRCMLTDSFVWFAGVMAEEMGIPWVAFRTAGASLLLVLLEIDSVRARLGTTELEHKTLDFIPGLSTIRGNDIPLGFMSKAINVPFTFPNMLYKMSKELHRATIVPVNSFHDLESSAVEQMQARSPFNAGMMERMLRVGVMVEGGVFTKRGMTKALRTVLKSEEGEAMRERAGELKSAALEAVNEDGDSARNYRELVRIVCGNDPL